MKRVCLALTLSLLFVGIIPVQSLSAEMGFSIIPARISTSILGNNDLRLQDAGLSNQSTLKVISLSAETNLGLCIRYVGLFPLTETGNGQLNKKIVFGNITYGPKDSNDTKRRDISVDYKFSDHRLQLDFLPVRSAWNGKIFLISSLDIKSLRVGMKGIPSSTGAGSSSESDKVIETTLSSNRALLGVGIGGQQRWRNVTFQYKVIYDFLNQSRGWLADADVRYELDKWGFAGVGYFYENVNMPLDTSRFNMASGGVKVQLGITF